MPTPADAVAIARPAGSALCAISDCPQWTRPALGPSPRFSTGSEPPRPEGGTYEGHSQCAKFGQAAKGSRSCESNRHRIDRDDHWKGALGRIKYRSCPERHAHAEAIAASRPTTPFVAVKSVEKAEPGDGYQDPRSSDGSTNRDDQRFARSCAKRNIKTKFRTFILFVR